MADDGRILIVDDEPQIREVCSRTIKQMGFQVQRDGEALVQKAMQLKASGRQA